MGIGNWEFRIAIFGFRIVDKGDELDSEIRNSQSEIPNPLPNLQICLPIWFDVSRSKSPHPERAGYQRRNNNQRLQQKRDNVISSMASVGKAGNTEKRSEECDEPV